MGKGGDIGLLDDVLGLAVIAHDAAGKAIEPLIVRSDDGAKSVAVARSRSAHNIQISSMDRVRN